MKEPLESLKERKSVYISLYNKGHIDKPVRDRAIKIINRKILNSFDNQVIIDFKN